MHFFKQPLIKNSLLCPQNVQVGKTTYAKVHLPVANLLNSKRLTMLLCANVKTDINKAGDSRKVVRC